MKKITVIADDRENNGANPYFDKYIVANNAEYKKKTIKGGRGDIKLCIGRVTTGDYNILMHPAEYKQPIVALIIERKSWKDLAASIKDGRLKSQHSEMEKVAGKLGCQYMYIIEGKLTYKKDYNVARHMPFKNLIAKVRHTILRGTPLIQTKDPDHTAEMIIDLARDTWRRYLNNEVTFEKQTKIQTPELLTPQKYMDEIRELNEKYRAAFESQKIPIGMINSIDNVIDENDSEDSIVQEPFDAEALVGAAEEIAEEHEVEDVETIANLNLIGVYSENTIIPAALTEQKIKSNSDILERMWIAIPTVSNKSVPVLMKRFKLSDLIAATDVQQINFTKEIASMKYPSGAKIGESRAKKIMWIAYSGNGVTKLDKLKTISMRLLAEVPGVTKQTAEKILEKYSLRKICLGHVSADDMAKIQKTKTRKVGQKCAEKIVELLTT